MLDAVTIEILWSRITSIVDEAAKVIIRTLLRPCRMRPMILPALTDAAGQSLAHRQHPLVYRHIAATVRHFGEFGPDSPDGEMQDGDVYITNNPCRHRPSAGCLRRRRCFTVAG